MPSLVELAKQRKKEQELNEIAKQNQIEAQKLKKLKENGKVIEKESGIVSEESIRYAEIVSEIDWTKFGNCSDLKRLLYRGIMGKSWRGTDAKLEKELNKKLIEIRK